MKRQPLLKYLGQPLQFKEYHVISLAELMSDEDFCIAPLAKMDMTRNELNELNRLIGYRKENT